MLIKGEATADCLAADVEQSLGKTTGLSAGRRGGKVRLDRSVGIASVGERRVEVGAGVADQVDAING
jgi:hypothetical protein